MLENVARKTLQEKIFEQSTNDEAYLSEIVLYQRVPLAINIQLNSSTNLYTGCVNWTDYLDREQKSCGTVRKW